VKKKCKPVTRDQTVGGQLYLYVRIGTDTLYVDVVTLCGRPYKVHELGDELGDDEGWVIEAKFASDPGSEVFHRENIEMGNPENDSRLFRYTSANRQLLDEMAEDYDLVGYLTLIGDPDPEGTADIYNEDDGWDDAHGYRSVG